MIPLLPAPKTTRAPFRRQDVLYIGLRAIKDTLARGTIPLANTEGAPAVCMSRSFAIAMLFAERHGDGGGVLALDRAALARRQRIRPHRDQVLCTKTRAAGYNEAEERVDAPITDIAPLVLAAWESGITAALRANMAAVQAAGFLLGDEPPIDWDGLFSYDDDTTEAAYQEALALVA